MKVEILTRIKKFDLKTVRDIMNLSSADQDKSPFTEEILISEDRPSIFGFRHLSPHWSQMNPQLRYCLDLQKKHLAGTIQRCREERTTMLPPSCDGEQPMYQQVIVNSILQSTVLGSTFTALSNQLILTTQERKVPKSKTWDLIRSTPLVTCQSPKQRWKCCQTHPIKHRTASFQDKIYDQDLPAHPRAEA